MKNLIIAGRILDKNILLGYKGWIIGNNILRPLSFNKEDIFNICKNYNILNCRYIKSTNSFTSTISIAYEKESVEYYDKIGKYRKKKIILLVQRL